MEKVGLEDGMSRRASEELWQYENRYDSGNETTSGSDNDSNVGGLLLSYNFTVPVAATGASTAER